MEKELAIPILPADDLRTARAFYVDGLGFAVRFEASEDGRTGLLGLARGTMLLTIDAPMQGHGRAACVSLQVESADRYYAEWRERVEILRPPRDEPWGARTFSVHDPAGNTIFVMGPVSSPENRAPGKNLVSITPFFIVKNLQASIAYYIERFGFQLDFQGPDDDVYYGQVKRDGVAIFLKTILPDVLPCPNHTRHQWARWDAYLYTLDPDALFDEFRQRGVSFAKELSFIDDGLWGFEVTDLDGYVLAFFRLRKE